jgi:photosystem II stability/assembly factor-like uncharacterized protein
VSSTAPAEPPPLPGRRRLPLALLILIALLFAIALARANRHTALPALEAIAFSDRDHGVGLFVAGTTQRCVASSGSTADGGAHFGTLAVLADWRCAGNPTVSQIATDGRGDVFAYGPGLIVSHDDTVTWAPANAFGSVLAVQAAGTSVWMVTRDCRGVGAADRSCPVRVLESADGGRHWKPTRSQPAGAAVTRGSVGAPAFGQTWLLRTSRSSGYVLSSAVMGATSATLSFTSDGGSTWSRRPLPCGTRALSTVLAAAPDGTLVAVCAGEPSAGFQAKWLAISQDGGRRWSQRGPCNADPGGPACARSPLSQGYLGEAVATSAQTVYVIGDRSGLVITRDSGGHWRNLGATVGDVNGTPAQVAFFGPRDGTVLGRENTAQAPIAIWHTIDGGHIWSALTPSGAS